jgi:hypothetical protein
LTFAFNGGVERSTYFFDRRFFICDGLGKQSISSSINALPDELTGMDFSAYRFPFKNLF